LSNFSGIIEPRRAERILREAGITRATNTMLDIIATAAEYLATYEQGGDGDEEEYSSSEDENDSESENENVEY